MAKSECKYTTNSPMKFVSQRGKLTALGRLVVSKSISCESQNSIHYTEAECITASSNNPRDTLIISEPSNLYLIENAINSKENITWETYNNGLIMASEYALYISDKNPAAISLFTNDYLSAIDTSAFKRQFIIAQFKELNKLDLCKYLLDVNVLIKKDILGNSHVKHNNDREYIKSVIEKWNSGYRFTALSYIHLAAVCKNHMVPSILNKKTFLRVMLERRMRESMCSNAASIRLLENMQNKKHINFIYIKGNKSLLY